MASGLADATEQARQLGLVWSTEVVTALDEANDRIEIMHKTMVSGLGSLMANFIAPIFKHLEAAGASIQTFFTMVAGGRQLNGGSFGDNIKYLFSQSAQADNSVTVELDDCLIDTITQYTEGVEVYNGTGWQIGTGWKRFSGDTATALPLPQLLAAYIVGHHWRPVRVLRANFRDLPGFLFDNVNAPVNGSDVYVWNGGTFTANTGRWEGEWIRYQFDAAAFNTTVNLPRNRDTIGTHDRDIKSLRQRMSDMGQIAGGTISRWIDGYLNQANGKADIGTPSGGDVVDACGAHNELADGASGHTENHRCRAVSAKLSRVPGERPRRWSGVHHGEITARTKLYPLHRHEQIELGNAD